MLNFFEECVKISASKNTPSDAKDICEISRWCVSMVLETQSAFILGRQILDGILIANKIADEANRNKKDVLMFKIDF